MKFKEHICHIGKQLIDEDCRTGQPGEKHQVSHKTLWSNGTAISRIVVDENGYAFTDCSEYTSRIVYCPFCGTKIGKYL